MRVTVRATLKGIDGRRLEFEVECEDEIESIGHCSHTRFIIDSQRFEERIAANKANEDLETVRAGIAEEFDGIYDTVYSQALESQLLQDLMAERRNLFPAEARILTDSPDKLINEISEEQMRLARNVAQVLLSSKE